MDRLVSVYDNGSLELRKKARLLAYCCLSGILAAFGFAIIRAAVAFDARNLVAALVMIAAAAGSLALLARGRYLSAINLVMGVLSLGFFGLAFLEPFTSSSVLFKYALYCDFLIVALCMISLRATQLAVFSAAYVAGIVAIYFVRAKPAALEGVAVGPIDLVTALIFVGLCGLLSWLVLSQLGATISEAEQEAETNRERAERVSALLVALQSGLDSGGELVGSSGKAVESLNAIRKGLGDIEEAAGRQDARLAEVRQWGAELSANSVALREGLDCHATSVSEAGSAVTAISGAMRELAGRAGTARNAMNDLVESAGVGERDMGASMDAIAAAERSAAEVASLVGLIEDVADRTSLLAMNAAIEAARAGQSGRGFAIVSGEIRKLSEETNRQAARIAATIKENAAATGRALEISRKAQGSFLRISSDVAKTHADVAGIEESLESSAGDIVSLSEDLGSLSAALGGVADLVARVDANARASDAELGAIAAMSRDIVGRTATMVGGFDRIATAIATVDGIGRNTIDLMGRVNGGMRALDGARPENAATGAAQADPPQTKAKE